MNQIKQGITITNQRPFKKKYKARKSTKKIIKKKYKEKRDDVQKMQKTEIKPIKKKFSQREKMCFAKK